MPSATWHHSSRAPRAIWSDTSGSRPSCTTSGGRRRSRRREARRERAAIPRETKTQYNQIKTAKRKLARIQRVAAGATGIQARFDRIDCLYGQRDRLWQKRQDEDWRHATDRRSLRRWKRQAIRERQVTANQVRTAHYAAHRTTLGLAPVNILPRRATDA